MSILKDFPCAEYRERYGLQALLETGTYLGASVQEGLRIGFERIVSCDIERSFVEKAEKSLRDTGPPDWEDHVTLFIGDTRARMVEMLMCVEGVRTLFFLDAHVAPACFARLSLTGSPSGQFLPLPEEIRIIQAHRDLRQDVLILDDLSLHVLEPAYWIGEERAALWGLPPSPPWDTVADLLHLFPHHDGRVLHVPNPDPALVLLPKAR